MTAALLLGLALQEESLPQAPPAEAAALEKIRTLGGVAMALAENVNVVNVDFSLAGPGVDDAALGSLRPVAPQLVGLNLAGTSVTDGGLEALAPLLQLRRLHLERTGIGDSGLGALKGLSELRYLNLYGTKVTDRGLAALKGLRNLRKLYVWQTEVTEAGAKELDGSIAGLEVDRGAEPPKPDPRPLVQPINAKCPVSGKDVDPAATQVHKGQAIAFCCAVCLAKFEKEPAKFIAKVAEFKDPDAKAPPKAPAPKPAAAGLDEEGFIRKWLILAPIPCAKENNGAQEIDEEQLTGEETAKPREGERLKAGDRELTWKRHVTPEFYIDFREFVEPERHENVVGYAVCYVVAETELTGLKLLMGSNDQGKILLNGRQVVKFDATRALEKDQTAAELVTLRKGENVLLFKVINEGNNWQGCVRFVDGAGKPVTGLRVTLTRS